jgi:hypothetical protein
VRIFRITIFLIFATKKIVFISENLCVLISWSDCAVIREGKGAERGERDSVSSSGYYIYRFVAWILESLRHCGTIASFTPMKKDISVTSGNSSHSH